MTKVIAPVITIKLRFSPDNARKTEILNAIMLAKDQEVDGLERWIFKVLGDWTDLYLAEPSAQDDAQP